jgi:hypothetical protein
MTTTTAFEARRGRKDGSVKSMAARAARIVAGRLVPSLSLAVALSSASGCGGGGSGTLTDGAPDACERDCDAQAAPACARMPPDYAASCKTLCAGLRSQTPDRCQAALRAQFQCALDRVTYTCQDGLTRAAPQGACSAEGAACAACRGSLCVAGF